jgi:hypothetical protein
MAPICVAGVLSASVIIGHAQAQVQGQRSTIVNYVCNLDGAPAQLTAEVQAVNQAGVFMDPSGFFAGSVATGDVTLYYGGTLVSQTARYSFRGENAFADFVELNTNERFRVQFNAQGPLLQMIVNPFGPGPTQYLCQMSGPAR